MKTCFALLALAVGLPALADTYRIDPDHANVRFAIDHFGTSTNTGGFYRLTGTIDYRPETETGSVHIRIPTASVSSGNPEFDRHLKAADLFNVARHPEMVFESTRFHFDNGRLSAVEGRLTLLGQTHPLTLTARRFNCYASPVKLSQVCGGDFGATLRRSRWGMNYLSGIMPDEVRLDIQIEAVKQGRAGAFSESRDGGR
ncbi:MAG: YceI family protein [Eikenella sp.]|nr:YceI family protein [Eikenella sp.]